MTTYLWPDRRSERLRKARVWGIVGLLLLLLIVSYFDLNATGRREGLYRPVWIGLLVILMNLWRPFRRLSAREEAAKYRVQSIETEPGGLRFNWNTWSIFIPLSEITQLEESSEGRGLYIRTRRRFRWFRIPRGVERYEELKGELSAMGFPVVTSTSRPWNWGLLFPFLFCGPLICDLLTQNRLILEVNFAVALMVGIAGATQTHIWIQGRWFRLKVILGAFIPAVASAGSLIFPFGLK